MAEDSQLRPNKSHSLGDSLGIVGLAVSLIGLAPSVPTLFGKAAAISAGTALLVYMAYRSHFTRNISATFKHMIATPCVLIVVAGGGWQLRSQSNLDNTNSTIASKGQTQITSPASLTPLAGPRLVSQRVTASVNDDHLPGHLEYSLQVVIATDKDVSPTAVKVKFSGKVFDLIGYAPAKTAAETFPEKQGEIIAGSPDTVLIQWPRPTPAEPIDFSVVSMSRVKVEKIESAPLNYRYPPDLKLDSK